MQIWNYKRVPLNTIIATEKYITSPVTSHNVAIKGAEEVAGSAPNLFRINGSIEPEIVPQRTIPISEKKTVKPISTQ